jgi:hypothetical protein
LPALSRSDEDRRVGSSGTNVAVPLYEVDVSVALTLDAVSVYVASPSSGLAVVIVTLSPSGEGVAAEIVMPPSSL